MMSKFFIFFRRASLFILLVSILGSNVAYASQVNQNTTVNNNYLKIFYYRDTVNAKKSLFKNWKHIDVLAPQVYVFDSEGLLKGSISTDVLYFARKHNIKIMPLVANDMFGQAGLKAILDTQSEQDRAIAMLVSEAKKNNFWGWQIDFEGMDISYRDKFSEFMKKLGEEFKNNNLISSVAVVSKVSDNPNDYPGDTWSKLVGVYDYSSLASSVDLISLMSYDDLNSAGPISGYPWLKKVIDYSLKFIPSQKLSLGIPLYYWRWNLNSGRRVSIGGYSQMRNIMNRNWVHFGYSLKQQESFMTYTYNKVPYILWYENARSMQDKINLIKKYHLNGFSAWVLGLENPNIFNVLK